MVLSEKTKGMLIGFGGSAIAVLLVSLGRASRNSEVEALEKKVDDRDKEIKLLNAQLKNN